MKTIILDTDVIINWLTKEQESKTGKELWKAPYEIISACEEGKLRGFICLTTLLEIRFLLRRKKGYIEVKIKEGIDKISYLLEVIVPGEIELIKANSLQTKNSLDPFDAILLASALTYKPDVSLISRDKKFIKIASQYIYTTSPESFLKEFSD
jgi:predicted nucleic acid-binding protein